jgi:hypothetical protein
VLLPSITKIALQFFSKHTKWFIGVLVYRKHTIWFIGVLVCGLLVCGVLVCESIRPKFYSFTCSSSSKKWNVAIKCVFQANQRSSTLTHKDAFIDTRTTIEALAKMILSVSVIVPFLLVFITSLIIDFV